ncbi:tRNA adenosine(34) deaminase TadA [Glaciecola sp. SC05]|uniref:tRNA adenosine(34) deaminase TadA n=1 Tax=Glaciecola sp. SC05 TaxID=1987355 RepID=UPI003528908B
MQDYDIQMMRMALEQAEIAAQEGEVPVGAILTLENKVIGIGRNQNILLNDPSAHAEMMAIREGAQALSNYRLPETTLYVTLEPCSMCAGLMVHSRIHRLVFGAADPKTGACGSISNIVSDKRLNHNIEVTKGVLQDECSQMLSEFFKIRRAQKKAVKKGV